MGWTQSVGVVPWVLPNPVILKSSPYFGLRNGRFGFLISWATNMTAKPWVLVEACTDPATSEWSTVGTPMVSGGTTYFSDSEWAQYTARFYRVRAP